MDEEDRPQHHAPSGLDVWIARALLVAGLWFGVGGLWGLARAAQGLTPILVELLGIGAGAMFLAGAWRMRAALRWDGSDDD